MEVAEAVQPAVVNVSARRGPDTVEEFLRRFVEGLPSAPSPRPSLGSGFIVPPEGEIATNAHVVRGAVDIVVGLADGSEYPATVVGADPLSDMALLRIRAEEALATLAFGSSSQLRVGEPVLAVGSPFGLEQTVTAGIVSATGRFIGAGPYDDFVQTDASINPGNSGGPLLDGAGTVVGINTAIVAPTGTWAGIGFAIPADLAQEVLERLRQEGRVVRGYLGVTIAPVSPDAARRAYLPARRGALVVGVFPGSPADRAGMLAGDVVTYLDHEDIRSPRDLTRRVAFTRPGREVVLELARPDVGRVQISVTLGEAQVDDEGVPAGAHRHPPASPPLRARPA